MGYLIEVESIVIKFNIRVLKDCKIVRNKMENNLSQSSTEDRPQAVLIQQVLETKEQGYCSDISNDKEVQQELLEVPSGQRHLTGVLTNQGQVKDTEERKEVLTKPFLPLGGFGNNPLFATNLFGMGLKAP